MIVMAANPNPARITDETWRFLEALLALEPGTLNGGIYANKSGYHNTRQANQVNWPGNYSIVDGEDLGGPADKAAAVDWTFPSAQAGSYDRIALYADRLLRSGQDRNDPRGDGLREFYGQADVDTAVEGWDFRYVRAVTSDVSHLWHIHFSVDRDKVTDWATFEAVLSILRGETVEQWRGTTEGNDMAETVREPNGSVWKLDATLHKGLPVLWPVTPAEWPTLQNILGPTRGVGPIDWRFAVRGDLLPPPTVTVDVDEQAIAELTATLVVDEVGKPLTYEQTVAAADEAEDR